MSDTQWHLNRSVSVGHLVTTVTVVLSLILWGAQLETRIALTEQDAVRQARVDARQDAEIQRMREEIRSELQSLNHKLDRYFERMVEASR